MFQFFPDPVAVDSIATRLIWARERMSPNWTQEELAKAVGVARGTVANWETERTRPKKADLVNAAKALNRSVEWFYRAGHPKDDPESQGLSPLSAPAVIRTEESEAMVEIPFAGTVPASDFDVLLEGTEPISVPARFGRRHRKRRFACRVVGASCAPMIFQGDVVVFEQDEAPPNNVFVLAQRREDHFATLKLLELPDWGSPILRAMNPDSADPDPGDGWDAIAKLVGVWRDRGFMEIVWHEDAGLTPRHFESR